MIQQQTSNNEEGKEKPDSPAQTDPSRLMLKSKYSPLKYSEMQECFSKVGPQPKEYWQTNGITFRKIKLTNTIPERKKAASAGSGVKEEDKEESVNDKETRDDSGDDEEFLESGATPVSISNSAAGNVPYKFILESFHKYCPVLRVYTIPKDKKEAVQQFLTLPALQHKTPENTDVSPFAYSELKKAKDGLLDIVGEENKSEVCFSEMAFIAVTHYQNNQINDLKKTLNPHAKGFRNKYQELDHLHNELSGQLREGRGGYSYPYNRKSYSTNVSLAGSPKRDMWHQSSPASLDLHNMKRHRMDDGSGGGGGGYDPYAGAMQGRALASDMQDLDVADLLHTLMKSKK